MKKYLCFSITVLLLLLLSANVMAEQIKESKFAPASFSEAGNEYLEFYQDGTWKSEDDTHTSDKKGNLRTIIIGADYDDPDAGSKIYKAWEFGYGWEDQASATGDKAKFVSLDIKRGLNLVDLGLVTMNLTLDLHDRYYRDEPYSNYLGLLGGGYVTCNIGLVKVVGSVGYSLYGADKSGDRVDIYTYNARAYSPLFSGLFGVTLGYRYTSYEYDTGTKRSNSGVTVGFTSTW